MLGKKLEIRRYPIEMTGVGYPVDHKDSLQTFILHLMAALDA